MKFFDRVQSEDLPHSSGIKTMTHHRIQKSDSSEDLPHSSGIKTATFFAIIKTFNVGRLAPFIGD